MNYKSKLLVVIYVSGRKVYFKKMIKSLNFLKNFPEHVEFQLLANLYARYDVPYYQKALQKQFPSTLINVSIENSPNQRDFIFAGYQSATGYDLSLHIEEDWIFSPSAFLDFNFIMKALQNHSQVVFSKYPINRELEFRYSKHESHRVELIDAFEGLLESEYFSLNPHFVSGKIVNWVIDEVAWSTSPTNGVEIERFLFSNILPIFGPGFVVIGSHAYHLRHIGLVSMKRYIHSRTNSGKLLADASLVYSLSIGLLFFKCKGILRRIVNRIKKRFK